MGPLSDLIIPNVLNYVTLYPDILPQVNEYNTKCGIRSSIVILKSSPERSNTKKHEWIVMMLSEAADAQGLMLSHE